MPGGSSGALLLLHGSRQPGQAGDVMLWVLYEVPPDRSRRGKGTATGREAV